MLLPALCRVLIPVSKQLVNLLCLSRIRKGRKIARSIFMKPTIGTQEFIWHDEVATKLGGWDPEGAARISGARFSVLKGPLARLERALGQWLLDMHT